jgi:EmrB/QacA subfamily drug resistance transporter
MTSKQRRVLIVSILASFVAFLDGSVVNVALPSITHQLGGGLAAQQWITDGYMLTLGALILLAGSLSDLFGRKRILAIGLFGFGITSLVCALAVNSPMLITARLFQGITGALLVPSSLALIMSTFSGKEQGKAIGSWTAWTGISFIIGPLLGGFMVDSISWRGIFAINLLPIAITLWLLRQVGQSERTDDTVKVDILGSVLCAIGLGLPVYGLIEQPSHGWTDPLVLWSLIIGIATLALFFWWEKRNKDAMLPFMIFRVRNFSVGNIATTAIYGALSLGTFILSIYLQQVAGYSALMAGMALLPVTIVMFFLSSRFGALSTTFGPRFFMSAGPLLVAAGYFMMLGMAVHTSYWTHLFPGIMLFALGLAVTVSPLTSAILGDVDTRHAGVASAVNNAVSRIAGLIAIALVGLITGPQLDTAGFHRVLFVAAVLFVVGGVISAIGIRNLASRLPQMANPK